MRKNNCLDIYFKTCIKDINEELLCNNCYIFITFLKSFNKKYLENTNLSNFNNIFYKISKTKTLKKNNSMYNIMLYLYNEDYKFKKEVIKKLDILCNNKMII